MSTLHFLSLAPSTAALATAAISAELAHLKQLAEHPEHAPLREHVATLAELCHAVQHTVSHGVHALAAAGEGLQGLLDLLEHAEDKPLIASRLAGLLSPLQRQLQSAGEHIGQIL